jgi:predicted dehydrogenase
MTDRVAGVAVIGCGLIGARRAAAATAHPGSRLVTVTDSDAERAAAVAGQHGAELVEDWRAAVTRPDVDVVVVSTPNAWLADIGIAALRAGRHVLIEKPMGRNVGEAELLASAAAEARGVLRVGFNHRFHPALGRAQALVTEGTLGPVLSIRARYGHGSRPGCEQEWRADPALAGGGELTDQGVHVADLIHWFAGMPARAFGYVQTAFWPIAPLEDNGFGLFRYGDGRVAQMHVSMTQWRNLFSFEVFCAGGSVTVEGLGGSYGVERLVVARRRSEGGAPEMAEVHFEGADESWAREWDAFLAAVARRRDGAPERPDNGDAAAGLAAMRMVDALYRSAASGEQVSVG